VILLPLLALVIGIVVVPLLGIMPLKGEWARYIAVASIAGVDTVLGGIRAGLEGKFRNDVFFTGFLANVTIAFFIAWLGDRLGIDMYLVAAIVLGSRIFTNLSLIRRWLLTKWQDSRERARREREQASAAASTTANP
jgi:small basic protein